MYLTSLDSPTPRSSDRMDASGAFHLASLAYPYFTSQRQIRHNDINESRILLSIIVRLDIHLHISSQVGLLSRPKIQSILNVSPLTLAWLENIEIWQHSLHLAVSPDARIALSSKGLSQAWKIHILTFSCMNGAINGPTTYCGI